ncbi:MAG TPA: serine/threonine-protein kinase [Labilithrix sp.]|jgi:serine/threonine-protein kinase
MLHSGSKRIRGSKRAQANPRVFAFDWIGTYADARLASERYVLGPSIAVGGMGAVHLARVRGAADFSRVVAIKRMHEQYTTDAEFVAMFVDEARMAARIRHANVVQTLDVLEVDRELWIVMEYVPGASLSVLARGAPVPPAIALAIFHDVLAGLDAAHQATDAAGAPLNLVHRDVSPHNVLVGTDGVARIVDFGIAKARNRGVVTQTGHFKGKLQYSAPEVLTGQQATVASDIWSAAVTFWEVLTGRQLFDDGTEAGILYQVLETRPPKVSERAHALGAVFDDVLARGLAADREARFASANAMLEAFEPCGRRASAREVAAWVQSRAASELADRAALVREVELAVTGDVPAARPGPTELAPISATEPANTVPMPPQPVLRTAMHAVANVSPGRPTKRSVFGRLSGIAFGILIVGAAIFGTLVVAQSRRGAPPVANASVAAPTTAPPPPSSPPDAPPSPASATNAPLASVAPSASARRAGRSFHASTSSASAGVAPPPACNPPWTLDESGDKHYKPECLKKDR